MQETTQILVKCNGKRFPLYVRTDAARDSDLQAVAQCFEKEQYSIVSKAHAAHVMKLYYDIVAHGQIPLIVDCGAHIGASVRWFLAMYPAAFVLAVEPSPINCEILEKNVVGCPVEICKAGIDAVARRMYLDTSYGNPLGHRLSNIGTGDVVFSTTLLNILSPFSTSYVPFLLKLDIEGAEQEVFTHTDAIDLFPVVILEPHDWRFPGQQISRSFFAWHVNRKRDMLVRDENVISINLDETVL